MRKFLQFIQSIFFGTWLLERVTCYWNPALIMAGAALVTSVWGTLSGSSAQKKAARQQASQARANAAQQAENVIRQAQERAYQNALQIDFLELGQDQLKFEYTYGLDRLNLQIDSDVTNLQRAIQYTDFDIEALGLQNQLRVREAAVQAAQYGIRAGVAKETANYYRGLGANTLKEFDLVRVLGELNLVDIQQKTAQAIEEVSYYAESAKLEANANRAVAKQNLAQSVMYLEEGKADLQISRRDNLRTIAAIGAKLSSAGRAISGSSKDIIADQTREAKAKEKAGYYKYMVNANAQVAYSLIKKFEGAMKDREAAFLESKKGYIQDEGKRAVQKSQAEFAITTIGYENKLNQINLSVYEAEAQAAIYGMSAGLARDMANYYSQTNDIQMRELLFKRSTYEQDILKTRNAGLLDLEYRTNMFNFATTESNMRMDALREDTNRSREEANWLATQHLLAGNRGYALNIQTGNAAATATTLSGISNALSIAGQINWGSLFGGGTASAAASSSYATSSLATGNYNLPAASNYSFGP